MPGKNLGIQCPLQTELHAKLLCLCGAQWIASTTAQFWWQLPSCVWVCCPATAAAVTDVDSFGFLVDDCLMWYYYSLLFFAHIESRFLMKTVLYLCACSNHCTSPDSPPHPLATESVFYKQWPNSRFWTLEQVPITVNREHVNYLVFTYEKGNNQ
jgi:hypothetical protein